jgi:cyclic beta-1,2-glucan synthetase
MRIRPSAKLFVQTEHLAEFGALSRRAAALADEPRVWAAHFAVVEGEVARRPQYETDRARFIGRGRIGATPAIVGGRPLSGTVGTVLDPIFSCAARADRAGRQGRASPSGRGRLDAGRAARPDRQAPRSQRLRPRQDAGLDAGAGPAAPSRHRRRRRRTSSASPAPILYADPRRPSVAAIARRRAAVGLWPHGISGDLPIVLLRIDDIEDIAQVRQLLRAHEYWRMKRSPSISSSSTSAPPPTCRTCRSRSRPRCAAASRGRASATSGAGLGLRAARRPDEPARRAPCCSRPRGSCCRARAAQLADQLARFDAGCDSCRRQRAVEPGRSRETGRRPRRPAGPRVLQRPGRLRQGRPRIRHDPRPRQTTPAPWINVIANPGFGFQVSAEGSGYTWAENSRENQLTPWSNDPVSDPRARRSICATRRRALSGRPTAQPIRDGGTYVRARHGFGYSRFEHEAHGIALDLLQYVPLADPIKISRLTLAQSPADRARRLSVTPMPNGCSAPRAARRRRSSPPRSTGDRRDARRNPWSIRLSGRVAFADLGGRQTPGPATAPSSSAATAARGPAALRARRAAVRRDRRGLDPCAALQTTVELAPASRVEIVWLPGQAPRTRRPRACRPLPRRRSRRRARRGRRTGTSARRRPGATPDRAMDIMLNGWLLYQTLACRIWARSAFYQASGAYGFRDQLQDGMALASSRPAETRAHLLRAAAGSSSRATCSIGGCRIPARACARASRTTASGSPTRRDLRRAPATPPSWTRGAVPRRPAARPGEHDASSSRPWRTTSASLFEHCARGSTPASSSPASHGLPLIGTGDWNDGMNRVGEGQGRERLARLAAARARIGCSRPFADARAIPTRAALAEHAPAAQRIEREAWDGAGIAARPSTTARWLGSRRARSAASTPSPSPGRCCPAPPIPRARRQAMASLERAADPPRRRPRAAVHAALRQHAARSGLHQGLSAGPARERRAVQPCRDVGVMAFANSGTATRRRRCLRCSTRSTTRARATDVAALQGRALCRRRRCLFRRAACRARRLDLVHGLGGWMYRAGIEGILGIRHHLSLNLA